MKTLHRFRLAGLLTVLVLVLAACGGQEAGAPEDQPAGDAPTDAMTEDMATEGMTEQPTEDMTGGEAMATGPACDQLPAEGEEGSLSAMADEPAATAASSNPLLTTLVSAVQEAGLVDTLNSEGPFTIFAPTNDAFAEIPQSDLDALLQDQDALTDVLTYHVHAGEGLTSDELAGTDRLDMVNQGEATLNASGDTIEVNGQADVVCADIMVDNGVVHLIDGVLMPTG